MICCPINSDLFDNKIFFPPFQVPYKFTRFTPKFKLLLDDLISLKNYIDPSTNVLVCEHYSKLKPKFVINRESLNLLPEGNTKIKFFTGKEIGTSVDFDHAAEGDSADDEYKNYYYYVNDSGLQVKFYLREDLNPKIKGPVCVYIAKSLVSAFHNNCKNDFKYVHSDNEVTLLNWIFENKSSDLVYLFDIKVVGLVNPDKDENIFIDDTSSEKLEGYDANSKNEITNATKAIISSGDEEESLEFDVEISGGSIVQELGEKAVTEGGFVQDITSGGDNSNTTSSGGDEVVEVGDEVISLNDNPNKVICSCNNSDDAVTLSEGISDEEASANSDGEKRNELICDSVKTISNVSLLTKVKNFFSKRKQLTEQRQVHDLFHGFGSERSKFPSYSK